LPCKETRYKLKQKKVKFFWKIL